MLYDTHVNARAQQDRLITGENNNIRTRLRLLLPRVACLPMALVWGASGVLTEVAPALAVAPRPRAILQVSRSAWLAARERESGNVTVLRATGNNADCIFVY